MRAGGERTIPQRSPRTVAQLLRDHGFVFEVRDQAVELSARCRGRCGVFFSRDFREPILLLVER